MLGQPYDWIENRTDLYYKHQWRDVDIFLCDPDIIDYVTAGIAIDDPVAIHIAKHHPAEYDCVQVFFNMSLLFEVGAVLGYIHGLPVFRRMSPGVYNII